MAKTRENRGDQRFYPKLKCAISLLDSLQNDKPNGNIFYYYYEIVFHAHLLSNFGASGESEKEFKHVLGSDWAKNKTDAAYWYNLEKKAKVIRFHNQNLRVKRD